MFRKSFSTPLFGHGASSAMKCSMRFLSTSRKTATLEMKFSSPECNAILRSNPIKKNSLFRRNASMSGVACGAGAIPSMQLRQFNSTSIRAYNRRSDQLSGFTQVQQRAPDEEEEKPEEEDDKHRDGYLPFPAPFHTINIISILLTANLLLYILMNWVCDDDWREFIVDHFTVSHENWHLIYPLFTSAFYQEHMLQLAIDCWLLWQFGNTVLDFLGAARLFTFWAMCSLGGSLIHVGRQYFELHYGLDPLEVRGRCFGPNPFILGLVAVEGLIFRHLNFIQSPPVPFLVLTAFVMVIDVWRIFTTKPEEHGASTGGALVAYLFWLMPTHMLGLNRLTATM